MTTRKPAVKGTTPEERAVVRAERSRINRMQYFCDKVDTARDEQELVNLVCQYMLAVGKDLTDEACEMLGADILRIVERATSGAFDDVSAGQGHPKVGAGQYGPLVAAVEAAGQRFHDARMTADAEEARVAALMATVAACEINVEDMPATDGKGYLYVLQFSTGSIKVGQTVDLQRRLADHRRDAHAFNVAITDYWVSPAHQGYLANERLLIAFCGHVSRRAKSEYFHGIDLATVREFAAGLVADALGGDCQ